MLQVRRLVYQDVTTAKESCMPSQSMTLHHSRLEVLERAGAVHQRWNVYD